MKNQTACWTLALLICLIAGNVQAQQDKFSTSISLGLTTPILDSGIGFHLGINPAYALSDYFSLEGQASYIYTRITGSFLSGREGNLNGVNALVGGRIYLLSPEKRTRMYVNALLGGNYSRENTSGLSPQQEFGLGFSLGGFIMINRFWVGLSVESPQSLVLKAGIIFKR